MSAEVFVADRLKVAREFRGITQKELAERVSASRSLISLIESGAKKSPSGDLVDAFAIALGFAPEFFFCPVNDMFRDNECSFRHRRAATETLKTRVKAHANLIALVLEKLQDLFDFPELDIPKFSASTWEDIEVAAEGARRHWNLGIDAPIAEVSRVLEHAGVFIVPHIVQTTKVDAFSRSGQVTIIFLNQVIQSTSRWIFDIAHECGHLVMHSGIATGTPQSEADADWFASAFLLPRAAFSREFGARPFSWEHVFRLKKRWRVSAAAIVRRAFNLRLIDAVTYRRAYKYMSWKSWNTAGEPFEPNFQPPNLLQDALNAMGTDVEMTLLDLCDELHLPPETFRDVTGVPVPLNPRLVASGARRTPQ